MIAASKASDTPVSDLVYRGNITPLRHLVLSLMVRTFSCRQALFGCVRWLVIPGNGESGGSALTPVAQTCTYYKGDVHTREEKMRSCHIT